MISSKDQCLLHLLPRLNTRSFIHSVTANLVVSLDIRTNNNKFPKQPYLVRFYNEHRNFRARCELNAYRNEVNLNDKKTYHGSSRYSPTFDYGGPISILCKNMDHTKKLKEGRKCI